MAGENAIQFNPRVGADLSNIYGANPAFDIGADAMPVNKTDVSMGQVMVTFQDTKSESVPQQMQNIISDNKIGKSLDALALMNRTFFNK
ncbi:MAG: hypothetical protein SPL73_04840 [Cyanobacteriota bacterium]|nr:hypothetical protein [Cyanobacteriota bacterium]